MYRLQFVHQKDLVSDVIALFGAGEFSHVDIVLDTGQLLGARSDSIGGQPPGVQIRPANYVEWDRQVLIEVPCFNLDDALEFAHQQVGKEYDKLAIAGFAVGRDWREEDKWFCSELAAVVGEKATAWQTLFAPANKVEPNALALIASAMRGRIVTVIK